MSGEEKDYPYTWEVNQNAKGFMQIRFKAKSEHCPEDAIITVIAKQLKNIQAAVVDAGFEVQPTEVKKEKKPD